MDIKCLDYLLTNAEYETFERDGFLVVKDVLSCSMVERFNGVVDDIVKNFDSMSNQVLSNVIAYPDFIGKDCVFLDLLDWYKVFPKIWAILGWNIHLYVSHITLTPPISLGGEKRLDWHEDSGCVSLDVGMTPAPRLSVKVGYFLTDVSKPGMGNFAVVPGSHLTCDLDDIDLDGAVEVCVDVGDAIIFDRRVWHTGGMNFSDVTRKVLFLGYSHRWFHPRDEMTVSHYLGSVDLIKKQLLGFKTGNMGLTSPTFEDVPLREWLSENIVV